MSAIPGLDTDLRFGGENVEFPRRGAEIEIGGTYDWKGAL